jgi:hypothetical protein
MIIVAMRERDTNLFQRMIVNQFGFCTCTYSWIPTIFHLVVFWQIEQIGILHGHQVLRLYNMVSPMRNVEHFELDTYCSLPTVHVDLLAGEKQYHRPGFVQLANTSH